MKAPVVDEGRAHETHGRGEPGNPASRNRKAAAGAGCAGWLVLAALLLLSVIPLAAGAFPAANEMRRRRPIRA